jgi:hypothetical protein
MDKELARHVAATAFRSAVELSDMLPILKEHCDKSENETFLKAIASASAAIHLEIGKKVFAQYPDLEHEFEARIKTFGRLI